MSGGNTQSDLENIKLAIDDCANQFHVDRRLILGMIIQESRGDVGVITTNSGEIDTAGLMQCGGCDGFVGQHDLGLVSHLNMRDSLVGICLIDLARLP